MVQTKSNNMFGLKITIGKLSQKRNCLLLIFLRIEMITLMLSKLTGMIPGRKKMLSYSDKTLCSSEGTQSKTYSVDIIMMQIFYVHRKKKKRELLRCNKLIKCKDLLQINLLSLLLKTLQLMFHPQAMGRKLRNPLNKTL